MIPSGRASGRLRGTRSRRRARIHLAAVAALSLPAVALAAAPAAASGGFVRVGTLAADVEDAFVADARDRAVVAVGGGADELTVTVFDGRSLKRLRRATLAGLYPQSGTLGRARVLAFDARRRLIHVLGYGSAAERSNLVNPVLAAVAIDHPIRVVAARPLATAFPPGTRALGMRLRPGNRALFVGQVVPSATAPLLPALQARATGVFVAEIDLASGAIVSDPVVVRGCQAAITNQQQSDVGFLADRVFVGCTTTQLVSVPGPGVSAIVEVNLADPSDQRILFLPGAYPTGEIVFDETAGRLLLVGAAGNRPAQAVWVFDLAHRTFVGQIAAGEANVLGAGLNPDTGRVYLSVDRAVLVSSDRGIEIPQAASFDVDTSLGMVTPIPFAGAIVVPVRGVPTVFRDPLPRSAFPAAEPRNYSALDALTSETVQYAADGQAFGMRVHAIGGINGAIQNILPTGGNYWSQPGEITGLKDGDRDLAFAAVLRAHLGEDEASGEAVSADPDPNTASDYVTLAGRAPGASAPAWPYQPAGCRDFGAGSKPAAAENASAECALGRTVVAKAAYPGVVVPGVGSVGSSESIVRLARDAAGRVTTTVRAEARHVRLAGGATIGLVASEVTAGASGVAGGSAGVYRRIFENVSAGEHRCTTQCDPSAVLAALSATLGAQVRVELPDANELATRGGAHGHAIREPWQHQQDVVLNNQDPTAHHVAALRLTFVNDGTIASRTIVEFAGASADATVLRVVAPAAADPPPAPRLPAPPRLRRVVVLAERAAPPPAGQPPAATVRVLRVAGSGWRFLATGGPATVARSIALWMLLLAPAFFAVRRRLLGRLPGGAG